MRKRTSSHDNAPLPPIRSFGDACCQALALDEEFEAPLHAAMCLGRRGEHRDLVAFTGWPHDLNTAVGYALARGSFDGGLRKLVLFTLTEASVREILEDDVRWFTDVRTELASGVRPIELLDWIKVDGEDVRSMAITVDGEGAWP